MADFKSFTIIKDGQSSKYMVMDEKVRNKVGEGSLQTDAQTLIGAVNELANEKQNKLIAGDNITIADDGTISATGSGSGGSGSIDPSAIDDYLSNRSTNPVQNKVITKALDGKADVPTDSRGNPQPGLPGQVPVISDDGQTVVWRDVLTLPDPIEDGVEDGQVLSLDIQGRRVKPEWTDVSLTGKLGITAVNGKDRQSVEYDGSKDVSIEIASGNSNAIVVDSTLSTSSLHPLTNRAVTNVLRGSQRIPEGSTLKKGQVLGVAGTYSNGQYKLGYLDFKVPDPSTSTPQPGDVLAIDDNGDPIWTQLNENEDIHDQIQDLINEKITVDSELSKTSRNPVENRAITSELEKKAERPVDIYGQPSTGEPGQVPVVVDDEGHTEWRDVVTIPTDGSVDEGQVPVAVVDGDEVSIKWDDVKTTQPLTIILEDGTSNPPKSVFDGSEAVDVSIAQNAQGIIVEGSLKLDSTRPVSSQAVTKAIHGTANIPIGNLHLEKGQVLGVKAVTNTGYKLSYLDFKVPPSTSTAPEGSVLTVDENHNPVWKDITDQVLPEGEAPAGSILATDEHGDPIWVTPGIDPSSFNVDDRLSDTSENPVQNKVIKEALDSKVNVPTDQYGQPDQGDPGQVPVVVDDQGNTEWRNVVTFPDPDDPNVHDGQVLALDTSTDPISTIWKDVTTTGTLSITTYNGGIGQTTEFNGSQDVAVTISEGNSNSIVLDTSLKLNSTRPVTNESITKVLRGDQYIPREGKENNIRQGQVLGVTQATGSEYKIGYLDFILPDPSISQPAPGDVLAIDDEGNPIWTPISGDDHGTTDTIENTITNIIHETIPVDDDLDSNSENPVQNKAITNELSTKMDIPTDGHGDPIVGEPGQVPVLDDHGNVVWQDVITVPESGVDEGQVLKIDVDDNTGDIQAIWDDVTTTGKLTIELMDGDTVDYRTEFDGSEDVTLRLQDGTQGVLIDNSLIIDSNNPISNKGITQALRGIASIPKGGLNIKKGQVLGISGINNDRYTLGYLNFAIPDTSTNPPQAGDILTVDDEGNPTWTEPNAAVANSLPTATKVGTVLSVKKLKTNSKEQQLEWKDLTTDRTFINNISGPIGDKVLPQDGKTKGKVLTVGDTGNLEWKDISQDPDIINNITNQIEDDILPEQNKDPGNVLSVSTDGTTVEWRDVASVIVSDTEIVDQIVERIGGDLLPVDNRAVGRVLTIGSDGTTPEWDDPTSGQQLLDRVSDLEETVNGVPAHDGYPAQPGLVDDVEALQDTVGDSTRGLVKRVTDLERGGSTPTPGGNYEVLTNKKQTISSSSTHTDYPTSKAVYDYVQAVLGDIEEILNRLRQGGEVSDLLNVNGTQF